MNSERLEDRRKRNLKWTIMTFHKRVMCTKDISAKTRFLKIYIDEAFSELESIGLGKIQTRKAKNGRKILVFERKKLSEIQKDKIKISSMLETIGISFHKLIAHLKQLQIDNGKNHIVKFLYYKHFIFYTIENV